MDGLVRLSFSTESLLQEPSVGKQCLVQFASGYARELTSERDVQIEIRFDLPWAIGGNLFLRQGIDGGHGSVRMLIKNGKEVWVHAVKPENVPYGPSGEPTQVVLPFLQGCEGGGSRKFRKIYGPDRLLLLGSNLSGPFFHLYRSHTRSSVSG